MYSSRGSTTHKDYPQQSTVVTPSLCMCNRPAAKEVCIWGLQFRGVCLKWGDAIGSISAVVVTLVGVDSVYCFLVVGYATPEANPWVVVPSRCGYIGWSNVTIGLGGV